MKLFKVIIGRKKKKLFIAMYEMHKSMFGLILRSVFYLVIGKDSTQILLLQNNCLIRQPKRKLHGVCHAQYSSEL